MATATKAFKFAAIGLAALLGVAVAGVAGAIATYYVLYPKQELVRNLKKVGSEEVTAELHRRFPLGSNSGPLLRYLQSEKYQFREPENGLNRANLPRPGFPCNYTVHIEWKEDAQRRLVELFGTYWNTCV
jgi:hypothetical protein